jgi:hypothetical protein
MSTQAEGKITASEALAMYRTTREKAVLLVVEEMTKSRETWFGPVEVEEVEAAEEGEEAPGKVTMTAQPALLPAPTERLPPTE